MNVDCHSGSKMGDHDGLVGGDLGEDTCLCVDRGLMLDDLCEEVRKKLARILLDLFPTINCKQKNDTSMLQRLLVEKTQRILS